MSARQGFELRHVVHLARPLGRRAGDLEQLRAELLAAPIDALFHHAVQYQLRDPGAEQLCPDDLSAWIGGVVQDAETAERLSFVVQGAQASPETLRAGMLEVLEAVPAKRRAERDAPEGSAFQFHGSVTLSFPTGTVLGEAHEVVDALLEADASVWFFHLVEEPWNTGGRAPLIEWLAARREERLAGWLAEAAASGLPIDKARARVLQRWRRSHIGRRLAEAALTPGAERREAGRQAIANLVRRTPRPERDS